MGTGHDVAALIKVKSLGSQYPRKLNLHIGYSKSGSVVSGAGGLHGPRPVPVDFRVLRIGSRHFVFFQMFDLNLQ